MPLSCLLRALPMLDCDTARRVVVLGCVAENVHAKFRPLSQARRAHKPVLQWSCGPLVSLNSDGRNA